MQDGPATLVSSSCHSHVQSQYLPPPPLYLLTSAKVIDSDHCYPSSHLLGVQLRMYSFACTALYVLPDTYMYFCASGVLPDRYLAFCTIECYNHGWHTRFLSTNHSNLGAEKFLTHQHTHTQTHTHRQSTHPSHDSSVTNSKHAKEAIVRVRVVE